MLRCRNVFVIFLALLTGCASAPPVDLAAPLPRIRYLLTFDDGPSSASSNNSTASIADTLAQNPTQNGIKAIFFVLTRAPRAGGSDTGKKLMQRLYSEGHVLGLHSGSARGHGNPRGAACADRPPRAPAPRGDGIFRTRRLTRGRYRRHCLCHRRTAVSGAAPVLGFQFRHAGR